MIPVEKYSIRSVYLTLSIRNSRTRTPCYETVNGWGPFFIISTGGAPSILFQRMGPFFIISTGIPYRTPSLLFQHWGPLLYYFVGWAPSLLFQRVGPLLHYFNGWGLFYYFNWCMGPLLYYFNWWGPSLLFQGIHWALLVCSHLLFFTDSH